MTEEKELLFDVKDRIATITINRPKRKNAMNPAVMAGLKDSFEKAGADPEVSAIVLTG
ncbi:MAG: enoyl-CoA hydratase/isomerase family protein [Thermodesulfobacteriota bacterium]